MTATLKNDSAEYMYGAYPPIIKSNVHYDIQSKKRSLEESLYFTVFPAQQESIEVPVYAFR